MYYGRTIEQIQLFIMIVGDNSSRNNKKNACLENVEK